VSLLGADTAPGTSAEKSRQMGYPDAELAAVPEGANRRRGCGNPQAIAALKPGEVVIDLDSGGGFDCFLAARQVGDTGHVIGVDMTNEMLNKAHENTAKIGARMWNSACASSSTFRSRTIPAMPSCPTA
jgi:arsenite methyltransferase